MEREIDESDKTLSNVKSQLIITSELFEKKKID